MHHSDNERCLCTVDKESALENCVKQTDGGVPQTRTRRDEHVKTVDTRRGEHVITVDEVATRHFHDSSVKNI
ncbi:hypothetical protein BaRGS_00027853 [Batillaria attramentaria]|uniref:Hypervirulence associated protein TUDOR domain-containing protein n=1 Tax=Batillaria attramentaria TaxID=370345 RepID=A0ABD0K1J2_9CAEN